MSILDKITKNMYPNPKFYLHKDHINWKANAENLKEVYDICVDMWKETDWNAFWDRQKFKVDDFKARLSREAKTVASMSLDEKLDLLVNGERHLGYLYRDGDMTTVRREWRGVVDTAYDFWEWAKMWGMFLKTFGMDLIPALGMTFHYRWMISYFNAHGFMDKLTMGSLNKKVVLFDEMTMGQIMAGFPDLIGVPYQLLPVFLVSEIDQLVCVPYIDGVEAYGLPADTCPVPSSEVGSIVLDALPHMGSCFISSSMPCDGSTMASSYMSRRFPDLPVFHLCFPTRYADEATLDCAASDIKACIRFVEDVTGSKWDWAHYFECMKRFNMETDYELQKWEINRSQYPQFIGPAYELYRKWNYEMDGGIDPRVEKTCKKIAKLIEKGYRKQEPAWPFGKMKHRAIVWSCPAHYYANFSNWAANCWGIDVLVEMESLNFTKHLETSDKEEALRDLARLYERMVMRRHTNGGYQNVVDELWRQCEWWDVDIIIMYQNVACKNMATLQGILDEQSRQKDMKMIWEEHDLMDPRTVSRRTMRDKVSDFMRTVMNEEPVDESLVDFADDTAM